MKGSCLVVVVDDDAAPVPDWILVAVAIAACEEVVLEESCLLFKKIMNSIYFLVIYAASDWRNIQLIVIYCFFMFVGSYCIRHHATFAVIRFLSCMLWDTAGIKINSFFVNNTRFWRKLTNRFQN